MDRGELKTEAKGVIKDRLWDFWKPLLINYFIGMLIQLVLMQFLPIPTDLEPWEFSTNEIIISVILDLVTLPIVMGVNKYHLDYVRGKDLKLSSLKDYFVKFLPILGIYLVTTILTTLGTICFIVPGIIIGLALNFVYYLYIDEEKGVIETIKNCFTLMNGHKWDLFVLMLSFLGWALLGALTFGILYIWIVPYMNTTLILFYDKLREAK